MFKVDHRMIAHYIPGGDYLRSALEDGFLRTTPKPESLRQGELPVLWFTSDLETMFPATARKPIIIPGESQRVLTPQEMEEHLGGLYRLLVSSERIRALPWDLLKHRAKMPVKIRKRLVSRAKAAGEDPDTWWGTLEEVSIDQGLLQVWDGNEWIGSDITRADEVTGQSAKLLRVGVN